MAFQLKTNKELYELIEALSGTTDFTSQEKTLLLSLANQRMYQAYRTIDHWPRYLISYEPRTIENQILPLSEDAFYIFGAGTTAVDGLYVVNGTEQSVVAYTKYDEDDGTTEEYSLVYSGSGTTWNIITGAPDSGNAALYTNTDSSNSTSGTSSATIDETGWAVGTGDANAPQVRDLADIASVLRVFREKPFFNNSAVEYDFTTQNDGIHVLNLVDTTETKVWVSYKKRLTLLTEWDEDGSNATQEVPLEFFYFIAHGTYADFLEADGQTSKAALRSALADKFLYDEIEDPSVYMNQNTVRQRIRTHVTQQSR